MSMIAPFQGFGLGLRKPHHADFLETQVPVDFVEVISENFMAQGGKQLRILQQIRERYPVILHGVSMSIGSAEGLDAHYLEHLAELARIIDPLWVSDHLCWTRTSAHSSHDLLPLPLTRAALDVVCDNIDHAQNTLGRPMLFENPSSYLAFPEDEMSEAEFLAEMSWRTGCSLLLDLNNIYVSAHNHGWSAAEYLAAIPGKAVRQVHLAGHTPPSPDTPLAVDTHDRPVCDGVWDLFAETIGSLGDVAVMIEWDDAIPPLATLLDEVSKARALADGKEPRS
jgi:uncharacterized protein (UPF0276 family)